MEKYDIEVDDDDTVRYYKPGTQILHRTDGGPAVEYADGTKFWCVDGKRHRRGGPAVEHADGTKFWYVNGLRHRTDGPAVEYADGTKFWCVDGKRHRLDGPAIEWADGTKYWYIDDVKLTEKQFKEKTAAKEFTSPQNEWVKWADKQFNEKTSQDKEPH